MEAEIRKLTAGSEHERRRLDHFVAANLAPEYSRSQVARMIKAGLVTLNGGVARASAALRQKARAQGASQAVYVSLFVARPPPGARAYANESSKDSRQVTLIREAALQGDLRER